MANNESGGMTAIVAIVAIIVIVGVGYLIARNFIGTGGTDTPNENGATIDVDLPDGETQN